MSLSEPDYRLEIDNEIISTMDALHEEVYFGTIEFFHLIGRNARGADLTFPGRILPLMRPKGEGGPGTLRTTLTGFATQRPTVIVRYAGTDGREHEKRLDVAQVDLERPSVRRAVLRPAGENPVPGRDEGDQPLPHGSVSTDPGRHRGRRTGFATQLRTAPPPSRRVHAIGRAGGRRGREPGGAPIPGLLRVRIELRRRGRDRSVGRVGARAGSRFSTHRLARSQRRSGPPSPGWADLLPEGWEYDGERLVQWDTPIPPPEGHRILAQMARAFPEATMSRVGRSYLGKTTWALELSPPVEASHRSMAKVTTHKPTVVYSARQHANEVSSTSHVLRHAELLLTDPSWKEKLRAVNVVIHPFTNPDGAQLAYDLYTETPDYILHAGYLGSLGMDATSGGGSDFPIYPESKVRGRLWDRWLPDIFLNPHGYPSHQVVQLFSEYTGLVRRGKGHRAKLGVQQGVVHARVRVRGQPQFPPSPRCRL